MNAEPDRAALIEEFQDIRIVPESGGFVFTPGDFPELNWERPLFVQKVFGVFPLEVRWFDRDGTPVENADSPGRYGAYIEGTTPDGIKIRRAKTFYCVAPEVAGGLLFPALPELREPPFFPMSDEAWDQHKGEFEEFLRRATVRALFEEEEAAILMAGVEEWDDDTEVEEPLDDPWVRHREVHLEIRRQIAGIGDRDRLLERPVQEPDESGVVLRSGTPEEAGFSNDLTERLREICVDWETEVEEPFTAVVARSGVVIFHEAFGERAGEPVSRDTVYPLTSLTKMLAGIGLALFLDQGLLDLDSPLGTVLPDFPLEGPNAITLRQCLMHVSGLSGHGNWRGLNNPWLDNVVANGMETLTPEYHYSGVAYDLAGVVMQLAGGKSVPRFFHEHLFAPLEMKGARIRDLGSDAELRAIDLARVGQLLLNGGTYGTRKFFSEEVRDALLPVAYEDHFPGIAPERDDYGLGLRWAPRRHPHAGENGLPEDATILSAQTVGHGALSGSVFRVDLENEIVIAIGRFRAGDRHGEFLDELLLTIMDALEEDSA